MQVTYQTFLKAVSQSTLQKNIPLNTACLVTVFAGILQISCKQLKASSICQNKTEQKFIYLFICVVKLISVIILCLLPSLLAIRLRQTIFLAHAILLTTPVWSCFYPVTVQLSNYANWGQFWAIFCGGIFFYKSM